MFHSLSSCHDFYNLEAVARSELAFPKLRGRYGLTVMLDYYAERKHFLLNQEFFQAAGQLHCHLSAIGDDVIGSGHK